MVRDKHYLCFHSFWQVGFTFFSGGCGGERFPESPEWLLEASGEGNISPAPVLFK